MSSKKWKRFENLVARIQKSLVFSPTALVQQDEKVLGKDSKTKRQLDITVRDRVGQFELLCVVECKDYNAPIDVEEVGAFIAKLTDVRAHKGAMVAAKGFTQAAIEIAKSHEVDLMTALDAEEHDWKTLVRVPVLVTDVTLSFTLSFSCSAPVPISLPAPMGKLLVYRHDGSVIDTVHNLVLERWEKQGQLLDLGEAREFPISDEEVFINAMGIIAPVKITVTITAVPRRFFGHVLLPEISGFQDVAKGTFIGRFKTGALSFEEIERTWVELAPGAAPPVPVFMEVGVASSYNRISLDGVPIVNEPEGAVGLPIVELQAGVPTPYPPPPAD